jgi:hypothetical protein
MAAAGGAAGFVRPTRPLAGLLGYLGRYPEYIARGPAGFVEVEPLDAAAALVEGEHRG